MPLLNQQRPLIPVDAPDPNYPAYRFHPDGRQVRVNSKKDEPGDPWGTKPFPKPEAPSELTDAQQVELLETQLTKARQETLDQRAKFDRAWNEINEDMVKLQNAHSQLIAEEAAVREQRDQLLAERAAPAEAEAPKPTRTSKAK